MREDTRLRWREIDSVNAGHTVQIFIQGETKMVLDYAKRIFSHFDILSLYDNHINSYVSLMSRICCSADSLELASML